MLEFNCHFLSTQKQDREAEEVHRSSTNLLSTMLVIGVVGVRGHFFVFRFRSGTLQAFLPALVVDLSEKTADCSRRALAIGGACFMLGQKFNPVMRGQISNFRKINNFST